MTLSELRDRIVDIDAPGNELVHSREANCVTAARVKDVRPAVGARIDLKCAVCSEPVCLNQTSVKMIEAGATLCCFQCASEATGVPVSQFPRGDDELLRKDPRYKADPLEGTPPLTLFINDMLLSIAQFSENEERIQFAQGIHYSLSILMNRMLGKRILEMTNDYILSSASKTIYWAMEFVDREIERLKKQREQELVSQ